MEDGSDRWTYKDGIEEGDEIPGRENRSQLELQGAREIKGYPFRDLKSMGLEFNICQTKL